MWEVGLLFPHISENWHSQKRNSIRRMYRSYIQKRKTQKTKTCRNLTNMNQAWSEFSWEEEQWEAPAKGIQVPWEVITQLNLWFGISGYAIVSLWGPSRRRESSVVSKDTLGLWQKGTPGPNSIVFQVSLSTLFKSWAPSFYVAVICITGC